MKNGLVSIITPCYNGGKYISQTIDSVLAQTYPDWEMIIVDDGSKDGTLKIAQEYEAKNPAIFKAVHQENKGHGGAINTALAMATGSYFKVLDSDDWVDEDYYEKLYNAAVNNKSNFFFIFHTPKNKSHGMRHDLKYKIKDSAPQYVTVQDIFCIAPIYKPRNRFINFGGVSFPTGCSEP